jgi:hypothetical protein
VRRGNFRIPKVHGETAINVELFIGKKPPIFLPVHREKQLAVGIPPFLFQLAPWLPSGGADEAGGNMQTMPRQTSGSNARH